MERRYLHGAAVTLLSRVQQAVAAARDHSDGLNGARRFGQAAGLSSLDEFSELLHTAVAEKLGERLTSCPEEEQRHFSFATDSMDTCSCCDCTLKCIYTMWPKVCGQQKTTGAIAEYLLLVCCCNSLRSSGFSLSICTDVAWQGLCRPVKFFHPKLEKLFVHGASCPGAPSC